MSVSRRFVDLKISSKSLKSKANILVIGVGNEYRGDDAVGPYIARKLKTKGLPRTLIEIQNGEGTLLMESWRNAHTVILLDAVNSGASPGKIYRFDAHHQPIPSRFFNCSTHGFGVAEALGLANRLKRLPPCALIYGIEGKTFEAGAMLSPEVERAAEDVMERVVEEVCKRGRIY